MSSASASATKRDVEALVEAEVALGPDMQEPSRPGAAAITVRVTSPEVTSAS